MIPPCPRYSAATGSSRSSTSWSGSPLEDALPVRELAFGLVSFYLGANLITHLDSETQIDALFARVESLAPGVAAMLRGS